MESRLLGADHFHVLGLERRYALDPELLRRAYLDLSRRFHPDRFAQKTPAERRLAVERSAAINVAYKTLLEPVKRAEYLLAREAGLTDLERLRAPQDILVDVLETRERVSELKFDESPGAKDALRAEKRKAEAEGARLLERFHELFALVDAGDKSAIPEIERALVLFRYNRGVLNELASVPSEP